MSDQKPTEGTCGEEKLNQPDIATKLSDAQAAFLSLKSTMDEEASTLQEERAIFEDMRKRLDSVHFDRHVKLNVGGQIFKTSIETLVKDHDSMLASMFSQRFEVKPDKEDGAYFIDRDGTHFRLILNYLRTGELIYPRENKIVAKELYLEAEFYQLLDIQKEVWPEIAFQKSSFIINSLTADQKVALLSWLPPENNFMTWIQLYSSVDQGWSSASFHQRCDDKGPTLVIARSGNNIFGGYAKVSWSKGSTSFLKDDDAFLFTLNNPTGALPTKISQLNSSGGIWCNPSYGPMFGDATSGQNIYFMNNTATSTCAIVNANYGFAVPDGQAIYTFISGNASFTMNYLEVFGLRQAGKSLNMT